MDKHTNGDDRSQGHAGNSRRSRDDAALREHASQASALLAARTAQRQAQPREEAGQDYPTSIGGFLRRNAVYIVSAAVVGLFAIGIVFVLRAVLPIGGVGLGSDSAIERYESPYDWACLDRSGERYRYVVDGNVKSRVGIDVSENQHEIDWNAVAADGIDFAMIRLGYRGATEGDLYLDQQFWNNIEGARAAGVDCGLYFFSQARTPAEAVEEADFVLEYLNGTPLEYPIAYDAENVVLSSGTSRAADLTDDEMTANMEAFCERIGQAGYQSMVYGNAIDLARYRYANLEQHTIWWAEYGVPSPIPSIDIAYWQYTNNGTVAGIPTAVDLNIDLSHALD